MPDQFRRNFDDDYRRGGRRDWADRASDEMRSWFGDDEARARRGNDERDDRYPYGGDRDRQWQEHGDPDRSSRSWRAADRGYPSPSERAPHRHSEQFGHGGQYGSSSYDRGSYSRDERGAERDWFRGGDDRPSYRGAGGDDWRGGRGDDSDRRSGQGDWSGNRWGSGGGEGSSGEWGGARSFGGYGTGGYGSGRSESGSYEQGGGVGSRGGGSGQWSRESYAGRGPKDYKRSDERIREEISDRLTDDHAVDASEITVQVRDGEVTLTGMVPGREQKRRAEDIAESVSGVSDVTNSIRVSRHGQSQEQSGLFSGQSGQATGQSGQPAQSSGQSGQSGASSASTSQSAPAQPSGQAGAQQGTGASKGARTTTS